MTHNVKVPFCMPELSIRKIISHRFHVDNDEVKSEIGYDMIIVCDLMVQLDLPDKFYCQVIQWNEVNVPIKEPRGLLGK